MATKTQEQFSLAGLKVERAVGAFSDSLQPIIEGLLKLSVYERIDAINEIRQALHEISPLKNEPVDFVKWIPSEEVFGNPYNPNSVAPPEMKLLELSIEADGYCVEESTPILKSDLTWVPAGKLVQGDKLVAFDENATTLLTTKGRKQRRYRTSVVVSNCIDKSILLHVETDRGNLLVTPNHPFLAKKLYGKGNYGAEWVMARYLRPNDSVMCLMKPWEVDRSYEAGWLSGFLDGEGTLSPNQKSSREVQSYRLAGYQRPGPTADKMIEQFSKRVMTKVFTIERPESHKWSSMVMARVDRMVDVMKILGSVRPERLIANGGEFWSGSALSSRIKDSTKAVVKSVTFFGRGNIARLSTSTKTYIANGFAVHNTQPIVAWKDEEKIEVIDGFHRHRVGKESKEVRKRIMGYLPVVIANSDRTDKSDRMAATVRHNKARGKHKVEGMSDIVVELTRRNWSAERICRELGMDEDEVLRLKQVSGLTDIFSDQEFSRSWNAEGQITEDDFKELTDNVDGYGEEVKEFRTVNTSDPNRIFHRYETWECYKAGFYATCKEGFSKKDCEEMYREFLADTKRFASTLGHVIAEWKHSCEHYLTNVAMNRIAWLGQASACYDMGIPQSYRGGFHLLSPEQQIEANETALVALNKWLETNGRSAVTMDEAISGERQSDIY